MNREQAAEALQNGYKLRHKYFTEDEYIYITRGELRTEDGYHFHEEFWKNELYKEGWQICT